MKFFPHPKFAASTVCALLVLTACSQASDSGTETDTSTEPPVDVAALDTGEYATEPHEPFGKADDSNGLDFETQRMAEFLAMPFEIDPALTERTKLPLQSIRSAAENQPLTEEEQAALDDNQFLYGVTSGGDVPSTEDSPNQQMMYQVLRFPTPENAKQAANQLASVGGEGSAPVEIPGHPEALAHTRLTGFDSDFTVVSYQPHGEYVLLSQVRAPEADRDVSLERTAKFIDVQAPLIDGFYGVEASAAPRPAGAPKVDTTIDQNEILRYTLPSLEGDETSNGGHNMGAFGPRGFALMADHAEPTMNLLTEADAKHTGSWATSLFRAGSEEQAERLEQGLMKLDSDDGASDAEPPKGLPNAKCLKEPISSGIVHSCFVRVGRYVGVAQQLDDRESVDQAISAQYIILQKADQDIED